jgi:multisubunit Na+/H+ antiporter MnhF subunit
VTDLPDPAAAERAGQALALAGALGLAVAAALAAPLLARRRLPLSDRVALLQLLGAKAVAGCVALGAALGQPALADAGLALALLGAVTAAVYAQGAGGGER